MKQHEATILLLSSIPQLKISQTTSIPGYQWYLVMNYSGYLDSVMNQRVDFSCNKGLLLRGSHGHCCRAQIDCLSIDGSLWQVCIWCFEDYTPENLTNG